jgi:hypothetical protein
MATQQELIGPPSVRLVCFNAPETAPCKYACEAEPELRMLVTAYQFEQDLSAFCSLCRSVTLHRTGAVLTLV